MNGKSKEPHLTRTLRERYLDGELLPPERATARAHLEVCTECRREVKAFAALFVELDRLPVPEPPMDFDVRVLDAVLPRAEAALLFRLATRAYALLTAVMVAALGSTLVLVGPSGMEKAAAAGITGTIGQVLASARNFGVGFVDLLKTLGDLESVAEAAGTLARGAETVAGAALPPQLLVVYMLTMVLAGLVLMWATRQVRERGVPNVCLSI